MIINKLKRTCFYKMIERFSFFWHNYDFFWKSNFFFQIWKCLIQLTSLHFAEKKESENTTKNQRWWATIAFLVEVRCLEPPPEFNERIQRIPFLTQKNSAQKCQHHGIWYWTYLMQCMVLFFWVYSKKNAEFYEKNCMMIMSKNGFWLLKEFGSS